MSMICCVVNRLHIAQLLILGLGALFSRIQALTGIKRRHDANQGRSSTESHSFVIYQLIPQGRDTAPCTVYAGSQMPISVSKLAHS